VTGRCGCATAATRSAAPAWRCSKPSATQLDAAAAARPGISYKTAWDRVQDMNNMSIQALVQRSAGGAGGGGTVLTRYALELVGAFRQVDRAWPNAWAASKSMAEPHRMLVRCRSLRTSAISWWVSRRVVPAQ
jgi:molybdate transport repressor ModE-like protein